MIQVTMNEAKEHLDDLLAAAERGETVLIENGTQVTQLVSIKRPTRRAVFGSARGLIKTADDFNEPLEDFREYME
jgi:antitoxin (DNA-binding transcriptional repressor) of toxin-antitoxin stability system